MQSTAEWMMCQRMEHGISLQLPDGLQTEQNVGMCPAYTEPH